MTLDIRTQCFVCAWRGECTKKMKIKEGKLHCPDFTRDEKLPPDEREGEVAISSSDPHKNVEDPFAD